VADQRQAGPRQRHTPDSLLEAAIEVFIRRGYEGASMADIAEAAGITKSSIYHHVAGKEALLERATGRALDALEAALTRSEARPGPAGDRLTHVVRRTAEILIDELPYVTLLLRVRGNTPAQQHALARRRDLDARMAKLLEAAAAEGAIRADVDPRLATRLVFGMVNSVTEWYRPGSAGRAQVVDGVVALVFDGLRGDPAARDPAGR
jgi:AcrR family transcriptional regulator